MNSHPCGTVRFHLLCGNAVVQVKDSEAGVQVSTNVLGTLAILPDYILGSEIWSYKILSTKLRTHLLN